MGHLVRGAPWLTQRVTGGAAHCGWKVLGGGERLPAPRAVEGAELPVSPLRLGHLRRDRGPRATMLADPACAQRGGGYEIASCLLGAGCPFSIRRGGGPVHCRATQHTPHSSNQRPAVSIYMPDCSAALVLACVPRHTVGVRGFHMVFVPQVLRVVCCHVYNCDMAFFFTVSGAPCFTFRCMPLPLGSGPPLLGGARFVSQSQSQSFFKNISTDASSSSTLTMSDSGSDSD